VGGWAGTVFVIALLAALPTVLWLQYNFGLREGWATTSVPEFVFTVAVEDANLLSSQGMLEEVDNLTPWERIKRMEPGTDMLWGVPIGIALYLGFSVLRLRLPWWPLHPVIFLVASMYPLKNFWWSLLIGWSIKQLVTRLGSSGAYKRGTALMIGVIAGDLIGGLIFMLIAAVYYLVTGFEPVQYRIFP
jgi:hypothetical protein